ncbi:MAG: hypothetical protein KY454_07345, partial [Actinobacteria bacterium]|nr:hypothetical protein [Actinomycetota bacterium]
MLLAAALVAAGCESGTGEGRAPEVEPGATATTVAGGETTAAPAGAPTTTAAPTTAPAGAPLLVAAGDIACKP